MKKILFKKILIDYVIFFSIALLSSSIIIWVFQAVNYLDIMIEDGRDYLVYVNYSLLNFPKILTRLMPFVLFFSIYFIITKYETSNEFIIFWNFGINKITVINYFAKFSIVLAVIQILLAAVVVPKSQDTARSFLRTSTVNFFGNFVKPQVFNDTIKDVTIFTERKDNKGNLYNLYLKKAIDENNFQITHAKKGFFKNINKITVLVLIDGETITRKNDEVTNFSFSKSDFPLNNFQTNTTTYKKTQEMNIFDLIKCLKILYGNNSELKKNIYTKIENCSIKNLNNLYKEIYKRIIIPLYIPLLIMIPFLLITSSKENKGYTNLKINTFIIGLSLIIFSETTIRFITKSFSTNLIISAIPILVMLILYFYFQKKFNLKLK